MKSIGFILFIVAIGSGTTYRQDFGVRESLRDFVFSDPQAWELAEGSLALVRPSDYKPAHRSPLNLALLADRQFGSFELEADLLSTTREYDHRDMCIVFNFVDPTRYYYAHIAAKTDDRAHNIFIVNGADRKKISTQTTPGFDWGRDEWKRIKLVRDSETGKIEVYAAGKLLMSAEDKTLVSGHIGFGSFDDLGRVDNIRVTSAEFKKEKTTFFERKD